MEQLCFEGFEKQKATDWKWSFSDYPQEKNNIKVFSCFSCGGGSTMGYKLAGCEVIGNCEIDEKMNTLYIRNHHPKHNYCMDIRDFNKLEDLPSELYNIDILDGSPPCTTFSMAGQREQSWGKKKKFREGQAEQTLDDLSFVFIETVAKLKPKCVIMENVEGLILGEAFTYVQRIYKCLDDAGYDVQHYLLKAELMGIPQTRHRVFFIAFRKDICFDFGKLDLSFNYEQILFGDIKTETGKQIKGELTLERIKNIRRGDKLMADVVERENGKRSGFNDVIVWDDQVAPTLRAGGSAIRQCDGTYYSDEDVINIQTFPQDYDFNGNNKCYVCGMSVPPIMMKRIVQRIIETNVFAETKQKGE